MAEPAVDNQESYRTRQDEESDSQEKKKIRFADISLTAAWIAASYQAYSPEQIRKDIQQEWVSKVTKEISKDQKFKAVYATRQRGEDRQAYDSRRIQQIEIRRAVSDLVSAHGDQLFEKGAGTTANLRETLGELINSDYQNLQANRLDLINQISKTQAELAEGFSQQNEKNNRRFKEAETLETIKNQEKAEHHAKVLTRRELKEELRNHVSKTIGPIAKPDKIQFADDLPKTRSGKIMRRILKVIAEGGTDYGNTTTLVDPNVVKILGENRVK